MQITQESPSSSRAPPGTAPDALPPGRAEAVADVEKGWGCTKPPLGLVSLPSVDAVGGGPAASCPAPQGLGKGGAEPAPPLDGANGFPADHT